MMSEIALFSAARSWFSSSQIADKKEKKMTVIVIVISKALERISRFFFTNWSPMKITVRFLGLFQITVIDRFV